jgi:hypothetical protein
MNLIDTAQDMNESKKSINKEIKKSQKIKTHSEEWVLVQANSNWLSQQEIRMSDEDQ